MSQLWINVGAKYGSTYHVLMTDGSEKQLERCQRVVGPSPQLHKIFKEHNC